MSMRMISVRLLTALPSTVRVKLCADAVIAPIINPKISRTNFLIVFYGLVEDDASVPIRVAAVQD